MKNILIVEDEIIIALDIAAKLKSLGYGVTNTAVSPQEALESIEQQIPDLIMMDINLKSDIDGIELCTIIKEKYHIPVVYMTSYSDVKTIERAMLTEPYGYIIKPYNPSTLAATLKTSFKRLELENKISRQTDMFVSILDNITNAVALTAYSGVIERVNGRFYDIFPYSDVSGMNIRDVFKESIDMSDISVLHMNGSQEIYNIDVNGTEKNILISANGLDWEDGKRVLISFTDLTEMHAIKSALHNAEMRFSKIFRKKIVAGALIRWSDLTVYDMNDAFIEMYKAYGGYYDFPLHTFIGEGTADIIRQRMKSGENLRLELLRQKDMKGNEFYANLMCTPVEFDNGKYIMLDISDVTEQVKMSDMQQEMQQKLIHANKMTSLGTLVSGVAHEINNPNNFIMFNSSLMLEFWESVYSLLKSKGINEIDNLPVEEFSADVEKLMQGIMNGSIRIKGIVQDLKGFAKSESHEGFAPVAMEKVVSTSTRILEHMISKTTENFIMRIQPGMPLINGNEQKLEQVVINVLMNALEATFSSSSLVEIDCRTADEFIVLTVTDEGTGIAPHDLDRITEPFFTTKQNQGGTGLGLSIAYSIIKEHKGSIDVRSEQNKGTQIIIKLPVM
jgi:signal transduction histidine kinase/AmiR/NasT family two-component response regulator